MSEVKSENTNGIATTTTTTNTNDPPPAPATTTVPAAPVIVTPPIVKGTIKFDPMTNICSLTAKWAMNQEQMDSGAPQSTNECTYQGKGRLPESLNGSFYMYMQKKVKKKFVMKNTKFVESVDTLAFTPQEGSNGKFDMKGTGANKFGAFSMNGTLTMDEGENEGEFTFFKHYLPKHLQPKKKRQPKANKLRGPLGSLQGTYTPPLARRNTSDRKRKVNSKYQEQLTEPEVPLKGPLKKCERFILDLMKGGSKNKKQYSDLFLNPVPLDMFKTYEADIKPSKPICFMDVKRKLYKGYYKNYDFFANDVRRVFHNAFVFNREEKLGLVYQAALHLSNEFEIKINKLHNEEVDKKKKEELRIAQAEEERKKEKERKKWVAYEKRKREAEKRKRQKERERERAKKRRIKEREKRKKEKERKKRQEKARKKKEKAEARKKKKGGGSRKRRRDTPQLTQAQLQQLLATASGGDSTHNLALMKQVEWMRNEIAALKRNGGGGGSSTNEGGGGGGGGGNSGVNEPPAKKKRGRKAQVKKKKIWDFNEKAELTEKINSLLGLDEAYMEAIIQMIQDNSDTQVDDEEEMELDIDNLNIMCLNKLDTFVTKSMQEYRKNRAKERARERSKAKYAEQKQRKLMERQAAENAQRQQQQMQYQQMNSNVSMFSNNTNATSNSLLGGTTMNTNATAGQQAPMQHQAQQQPAHEQPKQKYVESDDDNEEELAVNGAGGNLVADLDQDPVWNQMAANAAKKDDDSQEKQTQPTEPIRNTSINDFGDEEEFDAGF